MDCKVPPILKKKSEALIIIIIIIMIRASDFFFQDRWAELTYGAKNGGTFSEMMPFCKQSIFFLTILELLVLVGKYHSFKMKVVQNDDVSDCVN